MPWVTVGGRGDRVQERFGPVAEVRFVVNARSSGDIGLFPLACAERGFWRCLPLVPRFVMGIACLRFGNFGGRTLFGRGR